MTRFWRPIIFSLLFGSSLASVADHKYDGDSSIFSPKGKIYQVEYAIKAVSRARPSLGICTNEGVVVCGMRACVPPLQEIHAPWREKVHVIDSHVCCAVAGLTADALRLVTACRAWTQDHSLTYQEPTPVELLTSKLSDAKQSFTQQGGLRPWGLSFLISGWDSHRGYQLYRTDPSGNFAAFKAAAVGANSTRIEEALATALSRTPLMSLKAAKLLAVRLLGVHGGEGAMELAVVTNDDQAGEPKGRARILPWREVKALMDEVEKEGDVCEEGTETCDVVEGGD